jgi:hypothetical protein
MICGGRLCEISAQLGNRDIAGKEALKFLWHRNKNTKIESKRQ